MFILQLRREYREKWAKEFNKMCLWCGERNHKLYGYCSHPFSQTWDKDHKDSEHFEKWLLTTDYKEKLKKCSNYDKDHHEGQIR